MKYLARMRIGVAVALLLLIGMQGVASACPACYGNGAVQSSRFDGMNMAIMAMLGIIGLVLTGISTFFIAMRRRVRLNRAAAPITPSINDKGDIEWNTF